MPDEPTGGSDDQAVPSDGEKEGSAPEEKQPGRELPTPPSKDLLDDVRWIVERAPDAPLVVTLSGGPIESRYGPAELVGKVAERIAALIGDLSGGVQPMLYGVVPGRSLSILLGDAQPDDLQTQIPIGVTQEAALRVAELIDLDGDELYARAIRLGPPARRYVELTALVQTEGLNVAWTPRDAETRMLDPRRAGIQHVRLSAEPEMRAHPVTLNGVLYRVIAEPGRTAGRIGIHLFEWSAPAPGTRKHAPLIAYEDEGLHTAIRDGLIGEPVEAGIQVKQPRPGTAIDPKHVELELMSIKRGPGEASALGMSIEDYLDGA